MSYGRNPNYIYSDGLEMHFNFTSVPEDAVNQLLYHLLLSHSRDDLKERLLIGRELLHEDGNSEFYIEREDKVIKMLMDIG